MSSTFGAGSMTERKRKASSASMPRGTRPAMACAVITAVLLGLAGCGGGGGGGEQGAGKVDVTIGLVPVATVSPIYLGIEKGFFAQEGLNVTPRISSGGAEVVPSVISGDADVGFSNSVSLLLAGAKGLPIRILNSASGEAPDGAKPEEIQAKLFTAKDSSIRSAKDLKGKTVAVNTLDNIAEITARRALEKQGADLDRIKFMEVDFPEMLTSLEAGQVDAAFLVEPFESQATERGHHAVASPYYDTMPGLATTNYFVSEEYAKKNPEVVDRIARAINRSQRYAAEHPDEARAMLPKYTEIPKELIPDISFGAFPTGGVDMESLQVLADLMGRYGVIEERPNIQDLVQD
ncbi:MAG: PhnD/SsuA/transferrin family substrate-binding protein [Streptosporangiales bacterium]|nr:PhnD/SsuA/transferrin family substrate-binding protein [Streptosporangiales bacterium]